MVSKVKIPANIRTAILIAVILLSISGILLFLGDRQQRLNDAFINAVLKGDYQKVVELIDKGADIRARKRDYFDNEMAMHLAARCGHYDIVKLLLGKGIDIDEEDSSKRTLLNEVLRDEEMVRFLIERGADVNHKDCIDITLMHYVAGTYNSDELINSTKLLIDAGADLNPLDFRGMTPMQLAVRIEQYGMVEFLVSMGARITIDVAAVLGDLDCVKKLARAGEDPFAEDKGGMTALDWAVQYAKMEVVRYLVEDYPKEGTHPVIIDGKYIERALTRAIKEGDVNLSSYFIESIRENNSDAEAILTRRLPSAVETGKVEIVRRLIDNGADAKAGFSESLIQKAIANNSEDILKLILVNGADPNVDIRWIHMAPLHLCATYNRPKMVPILVEYGAKINAKDGNGDTPMDLASMSGEADVAQELIKAGVEINLWNAVRIGDVGKVRELMQNGANVNSVDKEGYAPIHLAVMSERKEMVEFLLNEGVSVNALSPDNLTAFDIAEGMYYRFYTSKEREKSAKETVALLRKHGAKRSWDTAGSK